MSERLRRDVYDLGAPGVPIDQVKQPRYDPLSPARYSCVHWINHLLDCDPARNATNDLQDGGPIGNFLRLSYLYWLEALSLCRSMSEGVVSMAKLKALLQGRADASALTELIEDARRFILATKWIIEKSPLQAYVSALIFSPARSLIRGLFEYEEPKWITIQPPIRDKWAACLQTLEGHNDDVRSVAFSHDSTRLASASGDRTVKIWDAGSGACLQTLNIGKALYNILFDVTGSYLHTEIGNVAIDAPLTSSEIPDRVERQNPRYQGVGLSANREWITWNSENVAWLPSEYRPSCSAVSGRTVGIGVGSGKVWICTLNITDFRYS